MSVFKSSVFCLALLASTALNAYAADKDVEPIGVRFEPDLNYEFRSRSTINFASQSGPDTKPAVNPKFYFESEVGPKFYFDSAPKSMSRTVLDSITNAALTAQRVTHNGFNRFVIQVDDFFGGAEYSDETNRSWARIRIGVARPAGESLEIKGRLKVRLVLPQSQQRLRVLFSTEDTEISSDRRRGAIENKTEQDAALALQFVRSLSDKLRLKFDIGARSRDSLIQIFGRISASNSRQYDSGWDYRVSNNFFLFSSSGFENRFRLDVRKSINPASNVFFRSSTSIESRKGLRGASVGQVFGVYADLSSKEAIAYEGLFNFVTSRDDEFDTRYLGAEFRIRYRRNIWRPWFYYEVWPTASVLASTNRELVVGVLFRAEVLFGQY